MPKKPGWFAGLPPTRIAAWLTLLAIGLMVGSLALLGLPSALWLTISSPVARLLTHRAPADSMWPMALMHSVLWPAFLPLAYLYVARRTRPGRSRIAWTILVTAAAAVALGFIFQLWAGYV